MAKTTRPSPQERIRCACPRWTTARECMQLRGEWALAAVASALGHSDEDYSEEDYEVLKQFEGCECPCHADEEDDYDAQC